MQLVVPTDINEVSEPDDEEIDKMILNDSERALKTRLWSALNQEWIASDREKKRVRKAEKKKNKLLSANQSSLKSEQQS